MLYGLYQSAQGAATNQRELEVTANNMANAGTTGFKRELALAGHYRPHADNRLSFGQGGAPPSLTDLPGTNPFDLGSALARMTGGNGLAATAIDLAQGPLNETGGDLDVALAGPGFFQIQSDDGPVLTRDGRFTRGPDGTLVTAEGGRPVLGEGGGALNVPANAARIGIAPDGTLSASFDDGTNYPLGKLSLVEPTDPRSLTKQGDGLLTAAETRPVDPRETNVRQGFVEGSGVDSVRETMSMIAASRGFETNVNLVKLQDDTLGRLLAAARP
ncbi:flagellar hook-basal body protein [Alienimonas californiensis]|uniref:Flagellar basal-body rod protein FlgG n=1 Tax=Alienimonas californiensis TaxID=2527989 RepID=A0A517P3Z2_9PLAN|nr:flagellar hook-basal body protein [Alienimonas californiensis]QDT14100.1 Flagellar basal-body rod protein FlgG [Alienimonas californiensis]